MQDIFLIVLRQLLTMGIMMAAGYFFSKKEIISENTADEISSMNMRYLIPISIAVSFQEDFKIERLREWALVFFVSAAAFMIIILYATLCYPQKAVAFKEKRLCTLIPNNAAFGLLIAQSLFGNEGTFLMSAQIVVSNILLWTYGYALLSEKPDLKKVIFNPAVVAVAVGAAMALLPWKAPALVIDAVKMMTGISAPLAMILAGSYVARISLRQVATNLSYFMIGINKLIITPLLLVPLLLLLKLEYATAMTIMIGIMTPTGTAAALFAQMFQKQNTVSSGSVTYNMILSLVTIPLVLMLSMYLFGLYA